MTRTVRPIRSVASWLLACMAAGIMPAQAAPPADGGAQALEASHRQFADELRRSPLGRPIHLESIETDTGLQGDVYAELDHPIEQVRAVLLDPAQWCAMLLLHINNRACAIARGEHGERLSLAVVRRYDKPVEEAFALSFGRQTLSSDADHVAVRLTADEGPLGTSHHQVLIEATPMGERKVFLHFRYGYEHNMMARMATAAYLATFGSSKRGFTVVGRAPDSGPVHIRGMRGLVERNAMRYFIALEAYLDGTSDAPGERFEARLGRWFDGIERHPRQLHEVDRSTYLALKRSDRDRQRDGAHAPGREAPSR